MNMEAINKPTPSHNRTSLQRGDRNRTALGGAAVETAGDAAMAERDVPRPRIRFTNDETIAAFPSVVFAASA